MILTKQSSSIQFLHQKLKSLPNRKRKMTEQQSSIQRFNQFQELRQISPKKLMEGGIFSETFIKTLNKQVKVRRVVKQEFVLIQSVSQENQNKKSYSKKTIRKQAENQNDIYPIKQNKSEFQKSLMMKRVKSQKTLQEKSIVSTNAGSEKSQMQRLSIGEFNDENQIIKLIRNQGKQQSQENSSLKIQDFQLLNFCGEGVFGSVFTARDKRTNYLCALKKILKNSLTCKQDEQSLIRQIKIHLKLNHPNIVKFYGCFSNATAIYFVLQLCQEGNLYQMLQRYGTFGQKEVRQIIRQVCSGIDYLHNQNIIHRDIKAENIIVQDKIVKICDLGWATEGQYSRKSLCGTPAYISPQVIQNKLYDKKIDVWSLGVLTFELVFGKIPFQIKTEADLQRVINQELIFPSEIEVSQSCKNFIVKCLEKDSFKRWDTSRLLAHPFLKKHEKQLNFGARTQINKN